MGWIETSHICWNGWIRDAVWLGRRRAIAYTIILGLIEISIIVAWLLMSRNGLDALGKPIGTDFISFWAASDLALTSNSAIAYAPEAHWLAQAALFPSSAVGYYGFFYPPVFLLICLPLALLPYLVSLALWLVTTGAFYIAALNRFLPQEAGKTKVLYLAFPAVLINIGHGQNGFLSAALFAVGILLLDRRPIVAGLVFGCLVFKPHLAVLLPFALVLRGEWKAFIATGLSAATLMLLSLMVFGADTWIAFFDISALARAALEQQLVDPSKMVSIFAAVHLLGGTTALAYAAQAFAALVSVVALARLARARPEGIAFGIAVVAATFLSTPFLLDYDLTLLAIPLAFLFREGTEKGFLPYEKILVFCGFVLPLIVRPLAMSIGLPLGPLVLAALLAAVVQRGLQGSVSRVTQAHRRPLDRLIPAAPEKPI